MGRDVRGAGGQPLRRRRQRGDDQRRAQGQVRPVGAVLGRRRRDRHPRRRQLDQDARRPQGQGGGRERDEQLVGGGPQGRGTGRVGRGVHPGHQAAQPGPGGRRRQRQHRGVRLPRGDRRQDRQDRRERRREERAGFRGPQEQRAAARPEQGARRAARRRHAGRRSRRSTSRPTHRAGPKRHAAQTRPSRRGSSCSAAWDRWRKRRSRKRFR